MALFRNSLLFQHLIRKFTEQMHESAGGEQINQAWPRKQAANPNKMKNSNKITIERENHTYAAASGNIAR